MCEVVDGSVEVSGAVGGCVEVCKAMDGRVEVYEAVITVGGRLGCVNL